MGRTAISLATASKNITASQIQGTQPPQGPSFIATPIPGIQGPPVMPSPVSDLIITSATQSNLATAASPLTSNASASSTRMSVSTDDEMTTQDSHSRIVHSVTKAARSSGTTWLPQLPDEKGIIAYSTIVPSLEIHTPLSPTFGTQTITANSESQNIFPSGLTLSKSSAPTLGSGTSISVLAPQISDIQALIASESLLSHATTMPTLSKKPSFLTVSGQTMTADSLGQYSTEGHSLAKSGVNTVSGTMTSLGPSKSDAVETSTEAFGPSATVNVGSGSNGTEVQRYSGDALGARDGLWGSSTMFLIFFVVLLGL